MKRILALMAGVVLASTAVAAAPLPPPPLPQGAYRFGGEISVVQTIQKERVLAPFDAGHKHIEELEATGYTCLYADSRQAICKKFVDNNDLPRKITQRLIDRYGKHLSFEFTALTGIPELVNDSELLKEWVIPQKVLTTEGSVSAYSLRELRGGLNKIRWIQSSGDYPSEIEELNIHSPELLSFVRLASEPYNEKTVRWREYTVELQLPRQN